MNRAKEDLLNYLDMDIVPCIQYRLGIKDLEAATEYVNLLASLLDMVLEEED